MENIDIKSLVASAISSNHIHEAFVNSGSAEWAVVEEVKKMMEDDFMDLPIEKIVEFALWKVLGPERTVYGTPQSVRVPFANGKKIATEYGSDAELNISSIGTALIQNVGRFVENYASDLFYDWETLKRVIKESKPGDNSIMLFGLRDSGVDGSDFVMSHANSSRNAFGNSHMTDRYRKLFAVRVMVTEEGYPGHGRAGTYEVEMRDITHEFYTVLNSEKNWFRQEHEHV